MKTPLKKRWFIVFSILLLFVLLDLPPLSFSRDRHLDVAEGSTIRQVANELKQQKLIRSAYWFMLLARFGGEGTIRAGQYYFAGPATASRLSWRLAKGDYGLPTVKVTIPEGLTSREIGVVLARNVPGFPATEFTSRAAGLEGYLFPDTYFFPIDVTPTRVMVLMQANYERQTRTLRAQLAATGHSEAEIITMASLLEEEAKDHEARRTISGILWNRYKIGMPLQVDAVFPYLIGKNSFQVSRADLAIDSPYNTYKYAGLPLGPISNPGLDSIEAAINPRVSNYLYYLSDYSGQMHYAVNFEEHKKNKNLYLN